MSRWSDSLGLIIPNPWNLNLQTIVVPNRHLSEDGQGGLSGSFAKKVLSHRTILFARGRLRFKPITWDLQCKFCIQPVGDPLHSHRLISRVELAHQGEGQFQSSGLRSNPTLFIDRNRQSPAHNHPFQQNKKDTQNTKVEKYKFTEAKIKKNHLALENTQQLFCIFWNF